MINHFPNFVCWKEIFRVYDKQRDVIYLDSISCFGLGLMLGVKGKYVPGPQMAHALAKDSYENCYFLLAEDIQSIPKNRKITLPFKTNFDGDIHVLNFLNSIPNNGLVILGISSPKQNLFANYLYSVRPDLDYFCFGAAVKQTWGLNANTRLRGSGFQWLEFLYFQPRRTIGKMARTIVEFFTILVSPSRIKLFRKFVQITKSKNQIER
mgnify:CR=1 FL=1